MPASQHTPQTSLQQLKLRSSCNACGQAKIKCDRGQPACTRCTAQGTCCVYGVSRKGGKPPRKQPGTCLLLPSRPAEPHMTSIDLTGTGTGSNGHNGINMNPGSQNGINIMLGLTESSMAIDSPLSNSDTAFQTWFPLDSFGSPGASFRSTSSLGNTPMSGQMSSSATASMTKTSAAERSYCTQETKDIMRQLYCANPAAPISDGVPARILDLDSVLTRNRDVVERLRALLKCPCARSPHNAMMYSSIVSRVLLWYQQAACNMTSIGTSPLSLSSFPPTLTGQEPSSAMPKSAMLDSSDEAADGRSNVSVLPTPITLGSFQSEDGNVHTALANCLILSELRRVDSLIDAFISLGTAPSASPTASNACPAAGEFVTSTTDASLFASLGTWLRTEHRRIVRKARSGLSLLDESLSF